MLAYLFEHVVEEAQPCADIAFASAVNVQPDVNIRLLGSASDLSLALTGKEYLGDFLPCHTVASQYQCLASKVLSQLGIRFPVANDIAVGKVVLLRVHIFGEHSCTGFPHR